VEVIDEVAEANAKESLIQISKKMSRLPLVARHDSDSRLFSLLHGFRYKLAKQITE